MGAFAFPVGSKDLLQGVIELFSAEVVQPDEDLLLLVESLGSQIGHFIQRRQIAAELRRQKEAAEAANAAKDKFLATLSHELRTPLTPVLMWAGEMAGDTTVPEDVREGLRMVARNIALEARLIDDLLDLTRIIRGNLHLHLQTADAHQLVRHAVEIVTSARERSAIALEVRLDAADSRVEVDPARLQQVFWNVVRNACKFTPLHGRVVIRSENLQLGRITFTISDTGVGIAPENVERIFDAFEQVGASREGLGLGLAISRAIITQLGGTIHAASEGLGRGASFVIELPTAPGAGRED